MTDYNRFWGVFILLCAMAAFPPEAYSDNAPSLKLNTVVIDPGHGGKDAGCVSRDRRTYEKNLTLAISRLLGQKIKEHYPEVKVYYTRTTDRYLTLNERADIANRNDADLFISVHINSFDKSTSPNGFSAHILGQSSKKNTDLFSNQLDVCKRENSVILLEEDYSTKYQGFDPSDPESFIFFNLMQSAYYEQSLQIAAEFDRAMKGGPIKTSRGISQDPFYVLWKTTMPAVLFELGFMSNPADLKVLTSESGKEQIAERMFNAFREFKKKYDGSVNYDTSVVREEPRQEEMEEKEKNDVYYGVQIMASGRRLEAGDRQFRGYDAAAYPSGTIYKYIVRAATLDEAKAMLPEIRKKFPEAFVVKIGNGTVSRP